MGRAAISTIITDYSQFTNLKRYDEDFLIYKCQLAVYSSSAN